MDRSRFCYCLSTKCRVFVDRSSTKYAERALWRSLDWDNSEGVAVRFHTRSAHRWGSLRPCPKGVIFRHKGPVFYGAVPEKGGFQARGSGFIWGRARKGWFSGTVQTPFCTEVPKCLVRRRIPAEMCKGSSQFCRTSTVIGVIWQQSTEVRKE